MKNKTDQADNSNLSELDQNRQIDFRYKRLKKAVDAAGGNQVVAPNAGVAPSTLSGYLNGGEWKLGVLNKIADACGVTLQWLLFGLKESTPSMTQTLSIPQPLADTVEIGSYDAEASAGFGRFNLDSPSDKIAVSRRFLADLGLQPAHTITLRVTGDSMEPTLKSGDRIIVSTLPVHNLDGLVLFTVGGQLLVKRLAVTSTGRVRIISDNDRYPSEETDLSRIRWGQSDNNDTITVIGRVAYRLQSLS